MPNPQEPAHPQTRNHAQQTYFRRYAKGGTNFPDGCRPAKHGFHSDRPQTPGETAYNDQTPYLAHLKPQGIRNQPGSKTNKHGFHSQGVHPNPQKHTIQAYRVCSPKPLKHFRCSKHGFRWNRSAMRDSPDENHAEITRYPISYGLQAKGNTHPDKVSTSSKHGVWVGRTITPGV